MTDRAILIARVSNDSQAGVGHYSLDAQLDAMRAFCTRNDITIVDERTETGRSAFTSDLAQLPELQRTILDIEGGVANALVMHESSRLARDEQLANELLVRLTACGARFLNASMEIDYRTPEGRLFFNNEAAINAYTSRKISQHSKKGKQGQFERGLPVGKIPFAYLATIGDDGRPRRDVPPIPVPLEAEALRAAFRDHALGRSLDAIARQWNAAGLQPRSVRGVDRFGRQTIHAILTNPFYYGLVRHNRETRPGVHEPIVTEAQWHAAQRPKVPRLRRRYPPLLLQGLAVCAGCGRGVYPSRPLKGSRHPGERYAYYREASRDGNRDCPDAGLLWPSAAPDANVDKLVGSLTMSSAWLAQVATEATQQPDDGGAQRAKLEERQRRVQREYLDQRLDDLAYRRLREECEAELALLPVTHNDLQDAAAQLASFGAVWSEASPESRNNTCRLLFDQIILNMREHIVTVRPAPEFAPLFRIRALHVGSTSPARG